MFQRQKLAENIVKYRKEYKLSQQDLASQLYVSTQSVSKWEHGDSVPDIEHLCKLSQIFRISMDILLGMNVDDASECTMIGIAGGGSVTKFVLFTETGKVIDSLCLEGSNPNVSGMDKTFAVLKMGIEKMRRSASRIDGIFAGISGLGTSKNKQVVTEFLQTNYPNIKIRCGNDILNVLGHVPSETNCVAVICGTESAVYVRENGKLHPFGGWGYLMDAEGSGYGIGRDALRAILMEENGIGDKTLLTELLREKFDVSVRNQMDSIYSKGSRNIATFASYVFEACRQGDQVAKDILKKNMEYIAFLINQAMKQYDCGNTVLIAGQLLDYEELILGIINDSLDKPMNIILTRPQIYGACVQCCRLCNVENAEFEANFKAGYEKIIGGKEEKK